MSDATNAGAASLRAQFADHLCHLTELVLTIGAIAHSDAVATGATRSAITLDDQMAAVRLGARALWPDE